MKTGFFEDSQIKERLRSLIGVVRMHQIELNWNNEDPITVNGNMLSASGCQDNNCENISFLVMIDVLNDVFYAGIKIEGNVEVFAELAEWKKLNESNRITRHEDFASVDDYFHDMAEGNFDANKYFAAEVLQYITVLNTTPVGVNMSYSSDIKEFKKQEFIYDKNTFEKDRIINGITYYTFLLKFKTYRTSRSHYEESEIRTEIGIDVNGKIASLAYPKIESLISY